VRDKLQSLDKIGSSRKHEIPNLNKEVLVKKFIFFLSLIVSSVSWSDSTVKFADFIGNYTLSTGESKDCFDAADISPYGHDSLLAVFSFANGLSYPHRFQLGSHNEDGFTVKTSIKGREIIEVAYDGSGIFKRRVGERHFGLSDDKEIFTIKIKNSGATAVSCKYSKK